VAGAAFKQGLPLLQEGTQLGAATGDTSDVLAVRKAASHRGCGQAVIKVLKAQVFSLCWSSSSTKGERGHAAAFGLQI